MPRPVYDKITFHPEFFWGSGSEIVKVKKITGKETTARAITHRLILEI
jgi:hypothetical protein